MTVYLDLVMGLNCLVDMLLLLGTGKLTGSSAKIGRVIAASIFGGIYGGVCLLPGFSFLGDSLWRLISLGIMGWMAFGWNRTAGKNCCVFLILSMALGGLVVCVNTGGIPVVLTVVGLWLLFQAIGGNMGTYVPLELGYRNQKLHLTALRDTGNGLRDPVTGENVVVISAESAEKLTGLTAQQLRNPLDTLAAQPIPGLRLIPYRAIGGSGMLLALRFPDGKLGERSCSPLVAFAPGGLGEERDFQALTGGSVS